LCRGGGQDVAHSSELQKPHGSSSVTFSPYRQVTYMFQKNMRMDRARIHDPTEEMMLSVVTLPGSSG
jgi:hypothetical protein